MTFVQHIPRPGSAHTPSALDFRSLDTLKKGVSGPKGASADEEKQVAQQFEALFLQQMLKQARQAATPTLLDSDQTRLAQSMADEQLALNLAKPGIGLAQALLDQIRRVKGAAESGIQAAPPELAKSRLPGLRSTVGEPRREDADSIDALIGVLTRNPATERIYAAIKGAPEHVQNFVSRMSHAARAAARESGVPEKLILGQAALESGWGRREIRREDGSTTHNLFGIKAGPNWKGKVAHVLTTEYENGVAQKVKQPFRAYDSYEESFADYARLISHSKRYEAVVEARTAEDAARRIQEAGYATDPAYSDKLISVMSYFDSGKRLASRD